MRQEPFIYLQRGIWQHKPMYLSQQAVCLYTLHKWLSPPKLSHKGANPFCTAANSLLIITHALYTNAHAGTHTVIHIMCIHYIYALLYTPAWSCVPVPAHTVKCPKNLLGCQPCTTYPEVIKAVLTSQLVQDAWLAGLFFSFYFFCCCFHFYKVCKSVSLFYATTSIKWGVLLQMKSNFQELKQPPKPSPHARLLHHTLA